jgi:outer membrane protein OmpA-like peptidoglycan-associated protein
MKRFFVFAVLNLALYASFAQQNVEFDKVNFKDNKKELKEAQRHIELGDLMVNKPNPKYNQAIDFYEVANKINPNNADLNYKIGICYINTNQKRRALEYFQKAYQLKPNVNKEIHYYLGWSHQMNHNWDRAIQELEKYKKEIPANDAVSLQKVDKKIFECNSGKELQKKPVRVFIDNLGPNINSEYPDYSLVMNADASEVWFTSRRPSTTGGAKDENIDDWFEDIYYSKRTGKKTWSPAQNAGPPLNTKGHDAAVAINPDGSRMIVYIDDKGDGNLYESIKKGGQWGNPQKLKEICSPYHEPSACYSYDGRKLYFVSNRPTDSKSKDPKDKDIYVAHWNKEKKKWDNITRLPETINSPYDEDGIFLHPDGKTLYFSSKGHNSMGGCDIFYSRLQDDDTWTKPVNIGHPINTPDDDIFFVVAANSRYAYMTSYRSDGLGDKDFYLITFLGDEKQPLLNSEDVLLAGTGVAVKEKVIEPAINIERSRLALLKGLVRDDKTKKPLYADIELIDLEKNLAIGEFNSDEISGKYMVSLPAGKNYGIAVKAEGYLFHSENFELPKDADFKEFIKNIDMKKIEVGEVIILKNIFFDFDKSSIRNESMNELERLTQLLESYPNLRIEISGHTDSRGSASYNKDLSQNRAKSVVDYLIKKGINPKRLEFKGYGKDNPVIKDEEIARLSGEKEKEEAHQENRRTEFKIIGK